MKLGRLIVEMEFGSHVYGTNVATSDRDYKGVFIPTASDLLLQRANKTSINVKTKLDERAKNSAQDVDREVFTLQSFIRLCAEGQTVAMDMLFTPESHYITQSEIWSSLQAKRAKLLHRGTAAFFGYAQQQAAKYGIKGSRIAAVRLLLSVLKEWDPYSRLKEHQQVLIEEVSGREHMGFVMCKAPNGRAELHLEVCNRKVPLHATVKYTTELFQRMFDEYGKRALLAEQNAACDWKALMHAVRVCEEAKELLKTGFVTFPRPERELLLAIRQGQLPYKQVAEMIENGLAELEEAKVTSTLPDAIDHAVWEDFLLEHYGREVALAR